MNFKLSTMVILACLVLAVISVDSLHFVNQKLVEIKSVDDRGDAKARLVTQTVPSVNRTARQVDHDAEDGAGGYSDDEDSKADGSGDADRTIDDQYSADVAHDEPVAVEVNATSTTSSITTIHPSPTTTAAVTPTSQESKSSMEAITSTQSSHVTPAISTVGLPSTSKPIITEREGSTITITQTVTTSRVTASFTVSTTALPVSTTSPFTSVKTESKPSVTEEPTSRPTSLDENTTSPATEVTKLKPVESTSESIQPSVVVKAHQDLTESPTRKTLFGFVTVEILIALLAGALFSILLVAFLVYRLKKRNEGSYELSETIALRPKELDEMGTNKEVFV